MLKFVQVDERLGIGDRPGGRTNHGELARRRAPSWHRSCRGDIFIRGTQCTFGSAVPPSLCQCSSGCSIFPVLFLDGTLHLGAGRSSIHSTREFQRLRHLMDPFNSPDRVVLQVSHLSLQFLQAHASPIVHGRRLLRCRSPHVNKKIVSAFFRKRAGSPFPGSSQPEYMIVLSSCFLAGTNRCKQKHDRCRLPALDFDKPSRRQQVRYRPDPMVHRCG